jgi:hypothetical protein
MNGRRAGLLLVVMAWLFGGCAGSGSDRAEAPEWSPEPVAANTLLVTTTFDRGNPWIVYREGARAELILRDDAGEVVERRVVRPGRSVEFHELPVGEYRLEPALRPCDGNCGYLDPRLDDCGGTVKATGSVQVRVDFVVRSSCTLHGPSVAWSTP